MIVSMIAAHANNRVIGKDNQLIWHLPADLKFFKNTTSGHTIIMGRKTYDSIGRPLPNRTNVVITRNKDFEAEGCEVFHALEDALSAHAHEEEVFIVGGAQLYEIGLEYAHRLYLTEIDAEFEGDTFFPEYDTSVWKESWREAHEPDERNTYAFAFVRYEKGDSAK